MRDSFAAFYDPFPVQRFYKRHSLHINKLVLCIAIALLVLILLTAVDVQAYYALPVKVNVNHVYWLVENITIANNTGFIELGGHQFPEQLICELFCLKFINVHVWAPFNLVNYTIQYSWNQYVNVTIQAPISAYSGDLNITLGI
jgi:hypothetical protein